jgi:hypothetical protein
MRFGAGLVGAAATALALPSVALACLTYVVGGHGPDWRPQAVLEVAVTRVDPAGPDLIDRNPMGYEMTVRRQLRGADSPLTFEVHRAGGCDTMNLGLGDRLVVAVGRSDGLAAPPADLLVPPDNYNSVWYHLRADGRLELAAGSSWIEVLPNDTTLAALLSAVDGMPSTDVADGISDREDTAAPSLGIVIAAAVIGLLAAMRRTRPRASLLVALVIAPLLSSCSQSPSVSPATTLVDPRHGHQVPITCVEVATADCTTIAVGMLRYFPGDAAKVEGIRVEPLADAPAGAVLAAEVTVDHEMAFSGGEQAYRVVRPTAGGELAFEIILEND